MSLRLYLRLGKVAAVWCVLEVKQRDVSKRGSVMEMLWTLVGIPVIVVLFFWGAYVMSVRRDSRRANRPSPLPSNRKSSVSATTGHIRAAPVTSLLRHDLREDTRVGSILDATGYDPAARITAIMAMDGLPVFDTTDPTFGTPAYKHKNLIMQELYAIGQELNRRGGLSVMRSVSVEARNLALQKGTKFDLRKLEHTWDYIGDWRA